MNKEYYEQELNSAKMNYELIKRGAESALCEMIQSGNFDAEKIIAIGDAIESAKRSVSYNEREYAKASAEEGGNGNA